MSVSIGTLTGILELQDRFTPVLQKATTQLQSAGQNLQRLGSNVTAAGQAMLPLSLAVTGVGAASLKMFAEFQAGMNRVRAVTGATGADFERLEAQALQLGSTTVFTARQAADAMGYLGLAGFKTNEILGAMPGTLQLAAAAQLEVASAADITAKIMRGYALSVEDSARMNDVLTKTFTSANTDLTQLGDAFRYAGPVAAAAGVKFEETSAALALLADRGFQASMGGTSLRTAIARLIGAVPSVSKQLRELGIAVHDSSGQMLPLADIFEQIEKKGISTEKVLGLFGVRAGPAMVSLLEVGSQALRDFTAELEDAGGTAERIQRIQLEGLRGQWILLKSATEGAAIAIGRSLEPAATALIEKLIVLANFVRTRLVPAFNELDQTSKNLLVGFAATIAVGAPLLIGLGSLIRLLGFAVSGLGILGKAAMSATGWVTGHTLAVQLNTAALARNTAAAAVNSATVGMWRVPVGAAAETATKATSRFGSLSLALRYLGSLARGALGGLRLLGGGLGTVAGAAAVGVGAVITLSGSWGEFGRIARALTSIVLRSLKRGLDDLGVAVSSLAGIWVVNVKRMFDGLTDLLHLKKPLDDFKVAMGAFARLFEDIAAAIPKVEYPDVPSPGAYAQVPLGPKPLEPQFVDRMFWARQQIDALTEAQRAQLDAAMQLGESIEELGKSYGLGADAIKLYGTLSEAAVEVTEEMSDAVSDLFKELSGAAASEELNNIAAVLQRMQAAGLEMSRQQHEAVRDQVMDLFRAGGQVPTGLQGMFLEGINKEVLDSIAYGVEGLDEALYDVSSQLMRAKTQSDYVHDAFMSIKDSVTVADASVVRYTGNVGGQLVKAQTRIVTSHDAWDRAIEKTAAGFQALAQVSNETMSMVTRAIGTAVTSFGLFRTGVGDMKKAFSGMLTGGSFDFAGFIGGALSAAGAIGQMVDQAIALGGALHDALTRTNAEKFAADLRRQFGLDVGEDSPLVREIDKLQEQFGFGSGGRQHAISLALPDIIAEGGGITADNFDQFNHRMVELFDLVERGGAVGKKAFQSLDDTFKALGEEVVRQGGLWDDYFIANLRRAQAEGLKLASVMELMRGQAEAAAQGLNAAIAGQFAAAFERLDSAAGEQVDSIKARMKEIDEERARLNDTGAGGEDEDRINRLDREWDELKAKLEELRGPIAEQQDDFDRLSRIALATFNGMVASGMSAFEAMQEMGSSIDDLVRASEDLGLEGNDAFEQLARWRELTETNAGLLGQLDGLNQVMTALYNMGGLTADAFADIQAQGVSAFQQLEEAGFTQNEALAAIAPMLETIIEAHKRNGLEIDEETQKLIDQAREQGLLTDEQLTTNQILIDGLSALIDLLGGEAPAYWKQFAADGRAAAEDVQDALRGIEIPDLTIDVRANLPDLPPSMSPEDRYFADEYGLPGAASGIFASGARGVATWFGEGGEPELGGPVDFMSDVLAEAMKQSGGAAGGGDIVLKVTMPVFLDGEQIDSRSFEKLVKRLEHNDGQGAPVGPVDRVLDALRLSR